MILDEDTDVLSQSDPNEHFEFVDVGSILCNTVNVEQNEDSDEIDLADEIISPQHITCFAHSLNLVATKDAEKALQNFNYKKLHRSSLAKIQAFWNLTSKSTLATDITYDICKCKFSVPIMTRWNSNVFDKLKLTNLKMQEWNFLAEFCQVLEPLAISLDNLQGEKYCYLGCVAPTLTILKRKLQLMSHLSYCEPLKVALLEGLDRRFEYIFDLTNEKKQVVYFKLNFTPTI
ncbi:hypothetical protein RN001_006088 [Aquatica leii]|uniref:Transposase n=1 Tax=Aquatica leii TaxID=1421715 RepID=A0AAN7Q1C8_9COLE|nr:hypothetical protein RN001_006088 [Aquatica leii]